MANRKLEAVPNELMDLAKREFQAEGAKCQLASLSRV